MNLQRHGNPIPAAPKVLASRDGLAVPNRTSSNKNVPLLKKVTVTNPQEIVVVSGLPRSGTSLMMQMLKSGGIEVVTDHEREADPDNPRGYFEYEAVKNLEQDTTWLPESRGKCVKMISMLLYQLPPGEQYRILFMERDLDEVLSSQETMLQRRNQNVAPRSEMSEAFKIHLEHLANWLSQKSNMSILRVGYKDLVERPLEQAERIRDFLGMELDVPQMATAVDPALYRNRNQSGQ